MIAQIIDSFQIRLCVYTPKWSISAQNHTLLFDGTDICRKQISESCLWKWRWNSPNQAVVKEIDCAVTYGGTEAMAVMAATMKHLTWTSKEICCNKSGFYEYEHWWCTSGNQTVIAGKLWTEEVTLCQVMNSCAMTWLLSCTPVHPLPHPAAACMLCSASSSFTMSALQRLLVNVRTHFNRIGLE